MRPTEWNFVQATDRNTVAIGAASQVTVATPNDLEEWTHPTLVRCRGVLQVQGTTPAQGAAGLIVADMPPAGGVTSLFLPAANADYDWLWFQYWSVGNADGLGQHFEVDSRAMRRIEKGEGIWFLIENDDTSDASISYWFAMRYLLKE